MIFCDHKYSLLIVAAMLLLRMSVFGQEDRKVHITLAGETEPEHLPQLVSNVPFEVDAIFTSVDKPLTTALPQRQAHEPALAVSISSYDLAKSGLSVFGPMNTHLKEANYNFAGTKFHGDYTIFSKNGTNFGFCSFGSSPYTLQMKDSLLIKNIVSRVKYKTDIVVVSYSYDSRWAREEEGEDYHSDVHDFAHLLIDAGADVVVMNGSKDEIPVELYADRLIVYSLKGLTDAKGLKGSSGLDLTLYQDGAFAEERTGTIITLSTQASGEIRKMLTEAAKYRGRPYRMGATGPRAFDCSGFTKYIFNLFGVTLPRTSKEQYHVGKTVNRKDLRPGDLVFFGRTGTRSVGHVGIVYSVDRTTGGFQFIHASTSRGVVIDNFQNVGYFVRRYIGAKRVEFGK